LTEARAETLKIRLYTPEIVALPVSAARALKEIQALADPCLDLDTPLKGPFETFRGKADPHWREAVRLAKIARLLPAILIAPDDPDAPDWLLSVDAQAIANYALLEAESLHEVVAAHVPLADAEKTRIIAFRPEDGGPEHLAIIIGDPDGSMPVLTRLHSECFTGDLLGSLKCDCGDQLKGAIAALAAQGSGVLLYLAQEGRGIGLINKLRAYRLQDQGFDTIEANQRLGFEADERLFLAAARMLQALGFERIRLLTNNPEKISSLRDYGIDVVECVPHAFPANPHNARYLKTKKLKAGHRL
jgi:GTP cyclohydrolase II